VDADFSLAAGTNGMARRVRRALRGRIREPVIGQYLATLAKAEHPMKAFDALFGLVAIALDHKALAGVNLSEIRSLKQTLDGRHVANTDYFQMAYDDAIRVISEAGSTEQAEKAEIQNLDWGTRSQMGLATRAALCTDPASFSASRRFVGFSIYLSWSRQRLRNTIAALPFGGVTLTFREKT